MKPQLKSLLTEIAGAMPLDRRRLRNRVSALFGKQFSDADLARLKLEIAASVERHTWRAEHVPRPEYPEELPVSARREEIARAIVQHPAVIVAGETGSGKTTQLPKICLEAGRGVAGMIGHTQPRRIAARSVASRIASELRSEVGHAVGYQVRFQERVSPDTYIKLMTDGILLAETQGDPDLLRYDTLIIDEAHERSLNIDFLLGYLKRLLPRRPDLKLIVTSATIDTDRFARHFGNAPVIAVSGRTYPVEVGYRPLQAADTDSEDRDMQQAIVEAVEELSRGGPGDVLVFLPGEREIRESAEALRKHHPPATEILPLFARLSVADQNAVFQPHGGRRIVLATNVAETSLTVPGIRYVIDTGLARVSRYSYRSKIQRLPIERISRASADQRKGRCGRIGPGVCIRLYEEADYLARPEYTEPEIQRTNLAAVILRMKALGLGEIEAFPFVDPPDPRFVRDGYRLLQELGALDERRKLTSLGRQLARFPLDPRLARMILAADREACLREVLIIASALSVQDPRERPLDAQKKADEAHQPFQDERSDFLAFRNLWDFYHEQARHLSTNKLRRLCQERFLAYRRMRDWHDVHQQLSNQVKEMGMRVNAEPAEYAAIHRALLAGLLGNLGLRGEAGQFEGSHGKKFQVFPGSALARKPPKWLVAAEIVETARVYARTAAAVDPAWIEELARHLVRRSYSEPHWERRAAQVAAFEQITLYGLTLVSRRKVNYGPIDPVTSRSIFIRAALVEGDYQTGAAFLRHNRAQIAEVQQLEDKARRRDILVDEELLYAFYDARLPEGIYSGKTFEQWRRKAERENARALFLDREELMRRDAADVTAAQFPDRWQQGELSLPLEYRFEPGHAEDGVTVVVPVAALNTLEAEPFQWLVPGLLQEKIAQLIRTLPKALRRNFVPAPQFAAACLQAMRPGQGDLLATLGRELERMTGVAVPVGTWQPEQLPAHLAMNFRLVDEQGKTLAVGRDLAALQGRLGARAEASFARLPDSGIEREDVRDWDFENLPEWLEVRRQGLTLKAYPALTVEGDRIALRLHDTEDKAGRAMREGLRALFMQTERKDVQYVRRNLPGIQAACLHYAPLGGCEQLKEDLVLAIVDRALFAEATDARHVASRMALRDAARSRLAAVANELSQTVAAALAEYHKVARLLKGGLPPVCLHAVSDVREQLEHLVFPGFVRRVPYRALQHYPRYLGAIQRRLEKLPRNPARDQAAEQEIAPLWRAYLAKTDGNADADHRGLQDFRWLLEELRVSLFAQELKTAQPVSPKRLRELWTEIDQRK